MNSNPTHILTLVCLFTACTLTACADPEEVTSPDPEVSEAEQMRAGLTCEAETLEEDSIVVAGVGAQDGPPAFGQLPPGAMVASTYLRIQDTEEAAQVFDELNGPIIAELSAPAPGLMGLSIRISPACNTARTITVWESEEAMMQFVTGPAHSAAMMRTHEVSRGGSITDVWQVGSLPELDWAPVIDGFKNHEGPVY